MQKLDLNQMRAAMRAVSAMVLAVTAFSPWIVSAQTCPFDNGGSTLENDGLLLTRYALGLRGATMVANTSFATGDAATIESNIACSACGLSVTGDSAFSVADATIISRKLAGFSGAALTNGLALGSGSRNTPAAVQSFLLAGCGSKKFINIAVTGVFLSDGATFRPAFGPTGGITLPRSGITPGIAFSFVLPPDYTPGTTIEAKIVWNSVSTSCRMRFGENSFGYSRPGSVDGFVNSAITVVGGELLPTSATANQSFLDTIAIAAPASVGSFQPGDAMIVNMFRDTRSLSGDTCAGDMRIRGISISYQ